MSDSAPLYIQTAVTGLIELKQIQRKQDRQTCSWEINITARVLAWARDWRTGRYDQSMLYTCMKFSKNTFVKRLKYEYPVAVAFNTNWMNLEAKHIFLHKSNSYKMIIMIP